MCDGKFVASKRSLPAAPKTEDGDLSVLARLTRLEDLVIGKSPGSKPVAEPTSPRVYESKQTSSPGLACYSPASEYEEAVHSLQETCFREATWQAARGLDIRIMSTHQISSKHEKFLHGQQASKFLCLPLKGEATLLLDYYFKYIDALQHVFYPPTVSVMMQSVYSNLESGLPVLPSDVALLLAIFASAGALFTYFPGATVPSLSGTDTARASVFWTDATLELLEFTHRTTARRLEEVQASIILGFLLFHTEGFSTRARCLFANAVAKGRDLLLHKIDAPSNQVQNKRNGVETEIKRRVWWHVVATDWYFLALSYGRSSWTN